MEKKNKKPKKADQCVLCDEDGESCEPLDCDELIKEIK